MSIFLVFPTDSRVLRVGRVQQDQMSVALTLLKLNLPVNYNMIPSKCTIKCSFQNVHCGDTFNTPLYV